MLNRFLSGNRFKKPLSWAGILSLLAIAVLLNGVLGLGTWKSGRVVAAFRIDPRPNIILILTDDLDDAVRNDGYRQALEYMPSVRDLLQKQGTTFENSFIPTSLCCPSRVGILRGQYTHNHQVYTNEPPTGGFEKAYTSDLEHSTIATWLRDAGYKTVLMGKYLNGYTFDSARTYIPPGWDEWYSPARGDPHGGYDYVMNENGHLVPYDGVYLTDLLSRKANDFIVRSAGLGKPFFLYVATYAPHAPATPAHRHSTWFPNAQTPRTPAFNEADVADKPLAIRNLPLLSDQEIDAIDDQFKNRIRSLQAVDELVGSMIETLRRTRELTNTYIIFTSDNGYHMGQHRQEPGKYLAYEEDIHVPLIVRGPEVIANRYLSYMVLNIDLAATFADLANIPAPEFVDGRSLLPLLGSNPPSIGNWRALVLVEQYPTNSQTRSTGTLEPSDPFDRQMDEPQPTYYGIRTMDRKYLHSNPEGNEELEFYDLQRDPYELQNIRGQIDPAILARYEAKAQKMHTCAGAGCRAEEEIPVH